MNILCLDSSGPFAKANERPQVPHQNLKVQTHNAGHSTMYASNQGEFTFYRCARCGALIEYTGADKTEAPPFWVFRGWAENKTE